MIPAIIGPVDAVGQALGDRPVALDGERPRGRRDQQQERDPRGGVPVKPRKRPAVIVIPEREIPGTSASAWARPM